MIVPDVNLLVYAYSRRAPLHAAARKWWEATLGEGTPIGLPWAVLCGFIRVTTHPAVRPAWVTPVSAREGIQEDLFCCSP